MFCDDLFHYLQNRIIRKRNRWSQAYDELELYNPELAISYRLHVLRNIFPAMRREFLKYDDNYSQVPQAHGWVA